MRRPSLSLHCALLAVLLGGCPAGDPDPQPDGGSTDGGTQSRIASISVSAPSATLAIGETVQLVATARDDRGEVLTVSNFSWTSSDASKLAVDAQGLATGVASGAATLTATAGGRSGSVALTVKAGAVHRGSLEADEIWRKEDGPHLVQETVYIGGPSAPVLRIEAGTEVRFAAGTSLSIGEGAAGALQIEGTASDPVRLTALSLNPQRGHWEGLRFGSSASPGSSLAHVTVEYCGGAPVREEACIYVQNAEIEISMQSVTVRQSSTGGIDMTTATFRAGSHAVSVHDSAGPALAIQIGGAGTLPTGGSYTGNARNVIALSYPYLERSLTLANHGIPYAITEETSVAGAANPTLTIAAGTELRFAAGVSLDIGAGAAGNLVARGTLEAPIVFTADSDAPAPGHWSGIFIGGNASGATTRLDHVVVRFGGIARGDPGANVRVHNEKGPIVTNSRLESSGDCGISREAYNGTPFTTDFTAAALGNTFAQNTGGDQCGPL